MNVATQALRFSQGNASKLVDVADGEADLVFTSPPYFSASIEAMLRLPLRQQVQHSRVERDVVAYALSLRPAFGEMSRVLNPTGLLILQTKDVRYGGWLIPITSVHRELIEGLGLRMVTRFWWQPLFDSRKHQPPQPTPCTDQLFRVSEVEEFQVYGLPGVASSHGPDGIRANDITAGRSPLWVLPGPGQHRSHPHQSPAAVVRRVIALYTAVGDLVVDPFAGSGTILEAALDLGRRAAGSELSPVYAARAERKLLAALRRQSRGH